MRNGNALRNEFTENEQMLLFTSIFTTSSTRKMSLNFFLSLFWFGEMYFSLLQSMIRSIANEV
jgi:hypothetical protein